MALIVGSIIVVVCVIGGYLMEHGNMHLLWQPAELVIIGGASLGSLIISSPPKDLKALIKSLTGLLKAKSYTKKDYVDLLSLFNEILVKIRKEGMLAIERDVENPHKSPMFQKYPSILRNHHAVDMIADSIRMIISAGIEAHQLESLLDAQVETFFEEESIPAKSVASMADGLPGLGIVAAVLGVVITMQKIKEPPEVLGHHIGAALVGTFLGVLLCYGFVGPIAKSIESKVEDEKSFLNVIKIMLVGVAQGLSPRVVVEFGRTLIPGDARPSFSELDKEVFGKKGE